MKFELEVGDRPRTVEIQRRADGYHVVSRRPHALVDVAHVDAASWSLLVRDTEGGVSRSVEATVLPRRGDGGFDVQIDGFHIPGPAERRARPAHRGMSAPAAPGRGRAARQRADAGKVVRVLVAPGDAVKARQGLVVVEAMKMENELRAARDGRVREVFVSEGQSVDAGTPLVVVE